MMMCGFGDQKLQIFYDKVKADTLSQTLYSELSDSSKKIVRLSNSPFRNTAYPITFYYIGAFLALLLYGIRPLFYSIRWTLRES